MSLGSNCFTQEREIPAGSTSDFKDTITGLELKATNCLPSNSGWEQEKEFEEGEETGDAVIPVTDEGRVVVNPVCQLHRLISLDSLLLMAFDQTRRSAKVSTESGSEVISYVRLTGIS